MPNYAASKGGSAPVAFSADATDLLRTAKVFKSLDDKSMIKTLRSSLRDAAKPIAAKAKSNAAYSKTIPRTITVETAFTAKKTGVFISAKRNKMPAGHEPLPGLLERGGHGSGSGTFRHRVFGRDTWVNQPTRPFLAPALAGQEDKVTETVRDAVRDLIKTAGLTVE